MNTAEVLWIVCCVLFAIYMICKIFSLCLCRFSFYEALIEECDKLSFGPVCVGVQTLGGANTIFGIRLARTPDIDNDVKLFEVIV